VCGDNYVKTLRNLCSTSDTIRADVPKVRSADPNGFQTGSEGIRGYTSVMPTLKFAYFLIKKNSV